jgi:hypothetical protein
MDTRGFQTKIEKHFKTKYFLIILNFTEIIYPSDDESNRVRYFGHLTNGIPNGLGTMTWKDGRIHKGTKH